MFNYESKFTLESGQYLSRFSLAYQTFGRLNKEKSNVIWIIHALTANSDPTVWWSEIVGPGKVIDTEKYFVICANTLGSSYGSTSPLSTNPETEKIYFHDFPMITNRDVAKSFVLLCKHLKIAKINTLIGPSIGGQQALEWAILQPLKIERLVLIATNAIHSPYGIAFNESQRMAIEIDPTWTECNRNAGAKGIEVARSIGMLSYRTKKCYDQTQPRRKNNQLENYNASSYQRYQGHKLSKRFNAFSYYLLTKTMDSHDIGRGKESIQKALQCIKAKTLVIGIDSDILFPISEQKFISDNIRDSKLLILSSNYGHDGFLTEGAKMQQYLSAFLKETENACLAV